MTITYHSGGRLQGLSTERVTKNSGVGSIANGTNNGGGFTQVAGKIGNGFSQSSGNYTGINDKEWGLGNNGWSFNFWINPQSPIGNDYVLQMDDESGILKNVFYMYTSVSDGAGVSCHFFDDTGVNINNRWVALDYGSWNMITFVWDKVNGQMKTYKNGTLNGTPLSHSHTNAGNFGIPNKNWCMFNYLNQTGTLYASRANGLDEFSFWETSLTTSEITELYNSGNGKKANTLSTNVSKLKVYYDFEDAPNGTLTNKAVVSETNLLPNVPEYSRFEETDTRKIYTLLKPTISVSQLKAYYKFNEASGNLLNRASDAGSTDSFSGEDMTNTGVSYQQTGKIGYAYTYDGVNDKSVGNSVANWRLLSNANDFTFSIWLKYTGTWENGHAIMASCNDSANQGMIFDIRETGDIRFVSLRGGVADFNDFWNTNISNANWHHYVIRYDNTAHQIELWLDGVNQGTKSCTLVGTANPDVVLQLMDTDYTGASAGTLDEFAVFARKITDAEIASLYSYGTLMTEWWEKQ